MKRFLLLAISLIIALSGFTGCKQKNENAPFEIASKSELKPEKIGYYSTLKLPIDDNYTEYYFQ